MGVKGVDFPEAIRDLAGRLGLDVPDERTRSEEDVASGRRQANLYRLLNQAQVWYEGELCESDRGIAYLFQRGISDRTAMRFSLGYAPDNWRPLTACFDRYDEPLLVEAGLVIAGEQGKRYDRFRDRIIFPIRNRNGRTVGFGGRILDKGEPKYLNTPETEVFHKGHELYGLFEHRQEIEALNQAIVVEGYMDVVMLDQHGIRNVVATLGTAMNADHVTRLLQMTDEIVFAFDGDAPGQKAAWRALDVAVDRIEDGKRVKFLFLPDDYDPDSYTREHGQGMFMKQVQESLSFSEFLFLEIGKQVDMRDDEGKVRLATLVQPYLERLKQAPLLAQILKKKLIAETGIEL
jgi:DNA primase